MERTFFFSPSAALRTAAFLEEASSLSVIAFAVASSSSMPCAAAASSFFTLALETRGLPLLFSGTSVTFGTWPVGLGCCSCFVDFLGATFPLSSCAGSAWICAISSAPTLNTAAFNAAVFSPSAMPLVWSFSSNSLLAAASSSFLMLALETSGLPLLLRGMSPTFGVSLAACDFGGRWSRMVTFL